MLSKNEKIALAVGGLAAAGGIGYLIFAASKAKAEPAPPKLPPPPPPKQVPEFGSTDPGVLAQQAAEQEWAANVQAAAWEAAQQAQQAMGGIAYEKPPQEPFGIPHEWEAPLPAAPEGYEWPELPQGAAGGGFFGDWWS